MNLRRVLACTTLAVVAIAWFAPPSMAAQAIQHGAGHKQKKKEDSETPPDPTPPPAETPTPTTKPASELSQASAAMQAAAKKVTTTFESNSDWTTAAAAVDAARQAYDTAHTAAVDALKSKPEYKAAVANRDQAQKAIDDLRTNGGSQDDISTAATKAMVARSAVSQMELESSSRDTNLLTAKAKLAQAAKAMSDLHQQEHAAIEADPDWQAAKKQYDDAKTKLASKS